MNFVIIVSYPRLQTYLSRCNLGRTLWIDMEQGIEDPSLFSSKQAARDWLSFNPTPMALAYKVVPLDEFQMLRIMAA